MSRGINRTALLWNRPASSRELRRIVAAFGRAARRARDGGADGVQLHAAHGYLLSRSLSSRHNRRRDEFGGSFARRLTLLREVFRAVQREAGDDFPVLVKLNAHDGQPGGLGLHDATLVARELESWGAAGIEVSAGTADVGMGFYPNRGDIPSDLAKRFLLREFPWLRPLSPVIDAIIRRQRRLVSLRGEAYFSAEAAHIAGAVGIPVIAVGGIRSVSRAEQLLRETPIAMVSLARPLVRQPALAQHWREGRHPSASCVSCNRCFVALSLGQPLRCLAEPTGARRGGPRVDAAVWPPDLPEDL
jgi:2,4-dienoyl-CoA reductase-like NADH-dependent reductase (Old Yellow Enzyme family)